MGQWHLRHWPRPAEAMFAALHKAPGTTRRSSLAMGTLRRSAVEASPEAGDRTWMRHWRPHRPTVRGGQWDPWRSPARAADGPTWRAKILRSRPQRLPHMPNSGRCTCTYSCADQHDHSLFGTPTRRIRSGASPNPRTARSPIRRVLLRLGPRWVRSADQPDRSGPAGPLFLGAHGHQHSAPATAAMITSAGFGGQAEQATPSVSPAGAARPVLYCHVAASSPGSTSSASGVPGAGSSPGCGSSSTSGTGRRGAGWTGRP